MYGGHELNPYKKTKNKNKNKFQFNESHSSKSVLLHPAYHIALEPIEASNCM
jgi:hypothetical protein